MTACRRILIRAVTLVAAVAASLALASPAFADDAPHFR